MTRLRQGWYLIFDTLTVHPDRYSQVFSAGSTTYRDYIRRWRYACGGADCHTSFGVVEPGSKTGRLHFHVLHFCRNLPGRSTDPNRDELHPFRREIVACKRFWTAGFSTPIAVRLDPRHDAFSRLGWRWPVEKCGRTWIPITSNSPDSVVGYMSKYVCKAYQTVEKPIWRIRMTRNLGTQQLTPLLQRLTLKELLQLMAMPSLPRIKGSDHLTALPLTLVRRLAAKEALTRAPMNRRRLSWLLELSPRPTLLERWRSMIRMQKRERLSVKRKTGSALSDLNSFAVVTGFDQLWKRLRAAAVSDFDVRRTILHRGGYLS